MYGLGNPIRCSLCNDHTVGLTEWKGQYRYWFDYKNQEKSECEIYDTTYRHSVTVTLPHLVGLAEKSDDIQISWNSFSTALLEHEVGHVRIAQELLETTPAALNSIGRVSCSGLKQTAQNRVDSAFQLVQDKSNDYDTETNSGVFQGTSF